MDRIQAIFQKKQALAFPNAISQMSILLEHRDKMIDEVSNNTLILNRLNTK